jgi:tetratricopeptide (TPR) repeat protein
MACVSTLVYAEEETFSKWEFSLQDIFVEKENYENVIDTIDMHVLDFLLERISINTITYPPRYRTFEEQQAVINTLYTLVDILDELHEENPKDPEIIQKAAFANRLGYNIDKIGSGLKAVFYYKSLLDFNDYVDNQKLNYEYGTFLSSTSQWHYEGIPYLEKSLELGNDDSLYSLGLLYYELGNHNKGLSFLDRFLKLYPSNDNVRSLYKEMKKNKVEFIIEKGVSGENY